MTREVSPREKLKFVQLWGKIRPLSVRSAWMFLAHPNKDCPVQILEAPCRWDCIETVYDLIKGYGHSLITTES